MKRWSEVGGQRSSVAKLQTGERSGGGARSAFGGDSPREDFVSRELNDRDEPNSDVGTRGRTTTTTTRGELHKMLWRCQICGWEGSPLRDG
ncbi:hypothetical protein EYF80_052582 [Liparis tanakae]|uniref:Uncharacterized protein n=1 Tax=Liparis tanakae TaxID=230148 RepID=A0A4Z2F8U7_9TELE|nr:hypothetical protein EYF80_052582 [Liparis tanakae]